MNNKLLKELTFEIIHLFISNKNEFAHGRDISRILKTNQKTTQDTLNLLEKDKILIKKQSGKNYNFKLNLLNSNTHNLILMSEIFKTSKLISKSFEIKSIIDDLKLITNNPIIIFGSYAKGYESKESDLDVLILSEKKVNISKISAKYNLKIHLIVQSRINFEENLFKENNFQLDIIQNHIICSEYEYLLDLWTKKYGKNQMV